MKPIRPICLGTLLMAMAISHATAAKKQQPLVYPFSEAKSILLLPVMDARHDKKAGVNLEKLRNDAVRHFQHDRYRLSKGAEADALTGLTTDDLKDATPELIGRLGETGDRWVMVICLDDISSKITFGSTGNAEVTGFLFDKQLGKLAWTNKGIGQAGQGGLLGMAIKPAMKGEALSAALARLLATIPSQPK
jgi:hypothetical protein